MQIQKQFDKQLYYSIIPDSKRQQTTTVDNKRLINGFILTGFAFLQCEKQILKTHYKNEQNFLL
jgi:hypothetical protein